MRPNGNLIRKIRQQSLREQLVSFAARIDVDAGQLSRIENGKRAHASYGWLRRVADGLGVPIEAIADEDEVA